MKIQKSFCAYPYEKWIDLYQTNIEIIFGSFCTYYQLHLTSVNAQIFDICLFF